MNDQITALQDQITRARQEEAEALRQIAEHQAREADAGLVEQEAQDARVLGSWQAENARLQDEGNRQAVLFDEAVSRGDMDAALAAWIEMRATRHARTTLHTFAQTASHRTTGSAAGIPDLRWTDPDLLTRLQESADKAANARGDELARPLTGE